MAFFLPKISSSPLLPHPCPSQNTPPRPFLSSSPLTNLEPPPVRDATREKPPALHGKPPAALHETKKESEKNSDKDDFYLNLGLAVRTLRDDLPSLFSKDLNYDIYRYKPEPSIPLLGLKFGSLPRFPYFSGLLLDFFFFLFFLMFQ